MGAGRGFTRNIAADAALLGRLLDRLALPPNLLSLLLAHARSVQRNADRVGLLSASDIDQVIRRHTADSLLFALVRGPVQGERWIDVGSGAGFPGLVLASCYPGTLFTLLEPQKRRAGHLELQVSELGLTNVVVDTRRLEEVEASDFDVAVARAFTPPSPALRSMVRVVREGGAAIVAVGAGASAPSDGDVLSVSIDDTDHVDSPGRFFMMTREA